MFIVKVEGNGCQLNSKEKKCRADSVKSKILVSKKYECAILLLSNLSYFVEDSQSLVPPLGSIKSLLQPFLKVNL